LVEVVSKGTYKEGGLRDRIVDTAGDVRGKESLRSSLNGKQIEFKIG